MVSEVEQAALEIAYPANIVALASIWQDGHVGTLLEGLVAARASAVDKQNGAADLVVKSVRACDGGDGSCIGDRVWSIFDRGPAAKKLGRLSERGQPATSVGLCK